VSEFVDGISCLDHLKRDVPHAEIEKTLSEIVGILCKLRHSTSRMAISKQPTFCCRTRDLCWSISTLCGSIRLNQLINRPPEKT